MQIESENSRVCDVFLGVPFAEPPIGKLRFQASSHYLHRYIFLENETCKTMFLFAYSYKIIARLKFSFESVLFIHISSLNFPYIITALNIKPKWINKVMFLVRFYYEFFQSNRIKQKRAMLEIFIISLICSTYFSLKNI